MFGLWRGPSLVRWGSAGIALLYGVLAVAYALNTPLWQNPDEPAHFNYVRDIAEGRGLPVLQPGDYDQQAIEALTAARFGAGGSVDGLRYEGHQPPLYYLLAAVVVRAGNGLPPERQVMAVRLLSIVLGLALLGVTYGAVARLYPDQPWLRLGVLGLVGLLPQHVAMLAAVNNDVLAEALVAAVLLCSLLLASGISARLAAVTGVLLGLALITKTTAYGVALLPGLALYLAARAPGTPKAALLPLLPLLQRWLVVYGVALLISAPWFLSNLAVYGWPDALGLLRHGEVVAGQPQAGQWTVAGLQDALATLFRSFWVQLGWMAAPARPEVYWLLAVLSGIAAAGWLWVVGRAQAAGETPRCEGWLLAVLAVAVVGQLVAYNTQFLQPQGRYLFPALIPIAVLLMVGLREVVTARFQGVAVSAMVLGLVALNAYALTTLVPLLSP